MQLRDLLNKNSVKDLQNHTVSYSMKRVKRTANKNEKEKHSKLAQIRMNNMLTVDEAAKLCGVQKSVILRWETTGTNPNDTMLSIKKYAKLLHMPLKKLEQYLEQ